MIFTPVAFFAAAATVAYALPATERRTDPDCTTILQGYLAADVAGVYKAFKLNPENQISYRGDGVDPLYVEFQACASLADQGPGAEIEEPGRIYVPSQDKCISISNQSRELGPYFTSLADCNTLAPERWLVRTNEQNAIYWLGATDEEGTVLQGECGLHGYRTRTGGVPYVNHPTAQIALDCDGTPFHLADTAL